jgi:hypothetical protein
MCPTNPRKDIRSKKGNEPFLNDLFLLSLSIQTLYFLIPYLVLYIPHSEFSIPHLSLLHLLTPLPISQSPYLLIWFFASPSPYLPISASPYLLISLICFYIPHPEFSIPHLSLLIPPLLFVVLYNPSVS